MKAKVISVALASVVLAAAGVAYGAIGVSAAEAYPLVYEATGKLEDDQTLACTLSEETAVTGNAITLKVFMKNTYHYSLPVTISVTSRGQKYEWSKTAGFEVGYAYASPDASEATVSTRLQWNRAGTLELPYMFYGEVVLPFAELNAGVGAQIDSVSKIEIEMTAAVRSNFASGDTWINDGVCMYLFGVSCAIVENGDIVQTEELADFTQMQPDALELSAKTGKVVGGVRKASAEDFNVFEAFVAHYNAPCETKGDMKIIESVSYDEEAFADVSSERTAAELIGKFYGSGQIARGSIVDGVDGTALAYTLDSSDYDGGKNSYAGLHFNFGRRAATDWSGAKGIAVYVENTADYLISFALEIFQYNQKTGLLEQYNLNDEAQKYKTLYAYNVETGEEFSYHTQTFMRVPANFKGWIRIPFSQYAAPAWSMASDYGNEGVLDFDANPVVKISITRLFNPNQDTTVILDDIALYYSDFGVGSLFDTDKPSIRACIEQGSVPAGA